MHTIHTRTIWSRVPDTTRVLHSAKVAASMGAWPGGGSASVAPVSALYARVQRALHRLIAPRASSREKATHCTQSACLCLSRHRVCPGTRARAPL